MCKVRESAIVFLHSIKRIFVELSFKTKELRTLFQSTRKAKAFLGEELLIFFQTIVADLNDAPTLHDFPHKDMLEIDGRKGVGSIFDSKLVIFFEVVGKGSEDCKKIMRIKIMEVKK